jgi:hypothetical protein
MRSLRQYRRGFHNGPSRTSSLPLLTALFADIKGSIERNEHLDPKETHLDRPFLPPGAPDRD